MFLVDLKLDPVDGSDLAEYVPDLLARCRALHPSSIVLIKKSVYDVAFKPLRDAGLPVVDQRIYFPASGRQKEFKQQFRAALGLRSPGQESSMGRRRTARDKPAKAHRSEFTPDEASEIKHLLEEIRRSDRAHQKRLRHTLRSMGFHINDFSHSNKGFTPGDFDDLVARGTITVGKES